MIKDNSMFEALIPRFPDYELIDSGDFEKLERFGRYVVRRPEPQAIWRRSLTEQEWRRLADASFLRDGRSEERGEWRLRSGMPSRWTVDYAYEGDAAAHALGPHFVQTRGAFSGAGGQLEFHLRQLCADESGGTDAEGPGISLPIRAERRSRPGRREPIRPTWIRSNRS